MAKKFEVIYGTNVIIPDPGGEMRPLTFFTDFESEKDMTIGEVAEAIENYIYEQTFIEDKGGYYRRTSNIVSYKIKIKTKGRK